MVQTASQALLESPELAVRAGVDHPLHVDGHRRMDGVVKCWLERGALPGPLSRAAHPECGLDLDLFWAAPTRPRSRRHRRALVGDRRDVPWFLANQPARRAVVDPLSGMGLLRRHSELFHLAAQPMIGVGCRA